MSDTTLSLAQAVEVAGEAAYGQIAALADRIAEIESIGVELRTSEEDQILEIAKAAKKSLPLINVESAIAAAGLRSDGYPVLALADYESSFRRLTTEVIMWRDGSCRFISRGRWRFDISAVFPSVRFPAALSYPKEASATVPLVPTQLRQNNTDNCMVLFEVNEWNPVPLALGDPYLLRLVAGNICQVLGSWDVTKTEIEALQAARSLGL